jgi:hypothetical protein
MAAPGAIPLSIKPATSGNAALVRAHANSATQRPSIADLRSRAATIADTFAERLTYQDAHPLRDKNTEAPEQTNTYGSHRLGDGELQPKHAQRPLQGSLARRN